MLTTLSSASVIYVLLMLLLLGSYPNLFIPDKSNIDKCFMSFFLAGVLAVIVFNMVIKISY